MSAGSPILIAGVGNIFLGDDAFGVEVVRELLTRTWPTGVDIVDFGIRGFDLAYALERVDSAIVVDAMSRGGSPGTLYLLEPTGMASYAAPETHEMTPDRLLSWIPKSDAPQKLRIVGCEPETLEPAEDGSLTPTVRGSVREAARMIERLVAEWRGEDERHA